MITPLDTCGLCHLSGEEYKRVAASSSPLAQAIMQNVLVWEPLFVATRPHLAEIYKHTAHRSCCLYDCAAVALVFKPSLFVLERLLVEVDDDGVTLEKGTNAAGAQPLDVATQWADYHAFQQLLVDRVTRG